MRALGVRQVPIVSKGKAHANGQVLRDVARLCGIPYGEQKILPVAELGRRQSIILAAAQRYLAQLSEEQLKLMLPNRPRSYGQLVWHIFNVADAFLEHERGIPLTAAAYNRNPAPGQDDKASIGAYGREVQAGVAKYFADVAATRDWSAKADVYYGAQTRHEYLERTTWHFAQHVRQVLWRLDSLSITADGPLPADVLAGLPMPEKVWDE
ncbi:MAG TPA: DinB family protein [Hyphomicrobiaceae bacterium]|nr:DinB family protein [Hyphomicrobiaceae bacterium]